MEGVQILCNSHMYCSNMSELDSYHSYHLVPNRAVNLVSSPMNCIIGLNAAATTAKRIVFTGVSRKFGCHCIIEPMKRGRKVLSLALQDFSDKGADV